MLIPRHTPRAQEKPLDPAMMDLLTRLDLAEFISVFAKEEVQLKHLLRDDDPGGIIAQIIAPLGPRRIISLELMKLKQQQQQHVNAAPLAPVPPTAKMLTSEPDDEVL